MLGHGTHSGYRNCRLNPGGACPACTEANRVYMAEFRAKRKKDSDTLKALDARAKEAQRESN